MSGGRTIAVGTELQRLTRRHRRAHAEGARDVAAGRDDAAPAAAADDQRLVGKLGPVALFDRRVEGVAVDMGDRQLGAGVGDRGAASRSAGSAPPARRRLEAVAAEMRGVPLAREAVTDENSAGRRRAPRGRRRSRSGRRSVLAAKATSSRSSAARWSSTASRKLGSAAASRKLPGPRPDSARKRDRRSGSPARKPSAAIASASALRLALWIARR